jgi:hypothetical protein
MVYLFIMANRGFALAELFGSFKKEIRSALAQASALAR